LLVIWLALFWFVIPKRFDRSGYWPRPMLRKRFARQNNVVLVFFNGSDGPAVNRGPPVVESAAIVAVTLRRSIFRGRQIAASALPVWAPITIPVAATATPPSETSTPPAASAIPVSAPVSTTVISLRPIVPDARRIVARRVVAGREILWRRSVRLRLTLVQVVYLGRLTFRIGLSFVPFRSPTEFSRRPLLVAVLFARLVQ
jgi:hypothetical protein